MTSSSSASERIRGEDLNPFVPEHEVQKFRSIYDSGRFLEAEQFSRELTQKYPKNSFFWKARGVVLSELGLDEQALQAYRIALDLDQNDREIFFNMGISYYSRQNMNQAKESFEKAINLDPLYAEAYNSLGNSLRELGAYVEADRAYSIVIDMSNPQSDAKSPIYDLARMNRGMLRLLNGNFSEGWMDYEHRATGSRCANKNNKKDLLLNREIDLNGKVILVLSEQGLGDVIQFCRYIKVLADHGARVVFDTYPHLKALMNTLNAPFEFVASADKPLVYDYFCPLLSLPFFFDVSEDNLPSEIPYLSAEPLRTQKVKLKLGSSGFKIGICWQGKQNLTDVGRSFLVNLFRPLADLPDVRLISIHKGDGESQLENLPEEMVVESMGKDFDSGRDAFVDTAAVMRCCDLIITSDTAVAHLAGALGVPVWVALKQVPDWRWMLGRSDSPWYPTMRLFRQKVAGDWDGVFSEIELALKSFIMSRT